MATPTSRRSSISSVASSGRRRKDQSLLDIASSLGQRTPERSQTSDDGISTRSRQLDFGSVDNGNAGEQEEQDKTGSTEGSEELQGVQEGQTGEFEVVEKNQVQEAVATSRPRLKRGRRETVYWSAEEEDFLRRGVEKYGIGKWKKILIDGKDVFSSHRTNVDLKDKWKNLSRNPARKRRKTPDTANPPEEERHVQPREDVRETAASERTAPRPRRSVAAQATNETANVENSGEEEVADLDGVAVNDSESPGLVTLKFATDKSSPELVDVIVNLDTCKDIASLKEQLRSSILADASPDADIQVIGLKSRVLLEDEDHLSHCIAANGVDFFLVFEENPEEFV